MDQSLHHKEANGLLFKKDNMIFVTNTELNLCDEIKSLVYYMQNLDAQNFKAEKKALNSQNRDYISVIQVCLAVCLDHQQYCLL